MSFRKDSNKVYSGERQISFCDSFSGGVWMGGLVFLMTLMLSLMILRSICDAIVVRYTV
jgi:hypothetical protein